ncbi:MAG: PIN/TRAM domain-containing protein [Bacillota bacterium]|nr:PIN/TRAM domain-containing protein [Bacillota bacterium]
MGRKFARIALALTGAILAYSLISVLLPFISRVTDVKMTDLTQIGIHIVGVMLSAIIFYFLSPRLISLGLFVAELIEGQFHRMPIQDILIGSMGLVIGLIIANLLTGVLVLVPLVGNYLRVAAYLVLGYLGLSIAYKKSAEIEALLSPSSRQAKNTKSSFAGYKILDTSVIIDGRILDICRTGFLEGTLIVASFVLEELRHIADSADTMRRNRGRRGLDVLNSIQKENGVKVEIVNRDFDDIVEVDSKLVRLAQLMQGKILTTDYNLNKVCEVQGVPVLNINELANAVKPVVLPGEEMTILIMREGKEQGQGVAYLDDGTMIVVEQGRKFIGDTVNVVVTTVLQTAAGRMIFARMR